MKMMIALLKYQTSFNWK